MLDVWLQRLSILLRSLPGAVFVIVDSVMGRIIIAHAAQIPTAHFNYGLLISPIVRLYFLLDGFAFIKLPATVVEAFEFRP